MIKFHQSLIMYCLISLALLLVVYKQLPVDNQDNNNKLIFVPEHVEQRPSDSQNKQISHYTNRYFGKIVGDFFKLSNTSQFGIEREIHDKIQSIERRVVSNEVLLKEIKSILNEVKLTQKNGHQVHEIDHHMPSPKRVATHKNNDNYTLYKLHDRVYNKMTPREIDEFYNRERISVSKYKTRVLHPIKDRQLLMGLFPGPNESRDRVTDQLYTKLDTTDSGRKTIYVSGSRVNTQWKFDNDKCNVDKCRITSDPKERAGADAVYTEMRMNNEYLNANTNPNQVTVVFQLESARNYPTLMTAQMARGSSKHTVAKRTLNWTASFRTDSVLNTPYERFTPYLNATGLPVKPAENYARGKTKMAAWFVSNCNAASGRNNYIKELQKYMTVDIYGRCGKSCPKNNKKCFEQLNTDYRFYLAFENSNCKDYLTEKVFWNGLSYRVIPVLFGAHYEEYKRVLPPNSFIHVDQFESPKELAKYLLFLSQNDYLYNKYFLWKTTGRFINTKFMCRLCTMVHLAPHFPMWYSDANWWWRGEDTCVNPTKDKNGVSYGTWKGKQPASKHAGFVKYGYTRN